MLAIVIPYYKYTFFESTLLSLQNQTNKNFKVYIGDDASPESPKVLLEKYKNSVEYFYKRFDNNLGGISLTKQWERCLELCNEEEWVSILGDDDIISDNFVAEFYNNLGQINQGEINVVRYASIVINEHGEKISKVYEHPKLETAVNFLIRKYKGGTRSSLSEYIFKRKSVQVIKFKDFPLAWNSDVLAVLEFSEWKNIFTINEAKVFFRLSGLNITSRNDDLVLKNNATFQFYNYLLEKQSDKLPENLVEILFDGFEKTILDNKKNSIYWIKLFYLYIKFFKIKRFLFLGSKIKRIIR